MDSYIGIPWYTTNTVNKAYITSHIAKEHTGSIDSETSANIPPFTGSINTGTSATLPPFIEYYNILIINFTLRINIFDIIININDNVFDI